jgi:5'-3' exonuclease
VLGSEAEVTKVPYSLDASKKSIQHDTNRQQKASRGSRHPRQGINHSAPTRQQHGRDPNHPPTIRTTKYMPPVKKDEMLTKYW